MIIEQNVKYTLLFLLVVVILVVLYYTVSTMYTESRYFTRNGIGRWFFNKNDGDQSDVTAQGDYLGVFIGYGQSNSDCCGEEPGVTISNKKNQFMHFDNETYVYEEPMLGAYCRGSCPYSSIGKVLLENGKYTQVVFATTGLPGASLKTLSGSAHDGYKSFEYFIKTYKEMKLKYGKVDGVLFHQGESDQKLSASYRESFMEFMGNIKKHGLSDVKIYVSGATLCNGTDDPDLLKVQMDLIDIDGVESGPDSDSLGVGSRYDGCHFTHQGFEQIGELWYEKLK